MDRPVVPLPAVRDRAVLLVAHDSHDPTVRSLVTERVCPILSKPEHRDLATRSDPVPPVSTALVAIRTIEYDLMARACGDAMKISERGHIATSEPLRDRFGMGHDVEVQITPTKRGLLIHKRTTAETPGRAGVCRARQDPEHGRLH